MRELGRYVVTEAKRKVSSNPAAGEQANSDPPFDIGSFLWGIAAGGIITIIVEGVAIYVAWPFIGGALKALVGVEVLR